jgi:hypothetical protein
MLQMAVKLCQEWSKQQAGGQAQLPLTSPTAEPHPDKHAMADAWFSITHNYAASLPQQSHAQSAESIAESKSPCSKLRLTASMIDRELHLLVTKQRHCSFANAFHTQRAAAIVGKPTAKPYASSQQYEEGDAQAHAYGPQGSPSPYAGGTRRAPWSGVPFGQVIWKTPLIRRHVPTSRIGFVPAVCSCAIRRR